MLRLQEVHGGPCITGPSYSSLFHVKFISSAHCAQQMPHLFLTVLSCCCLGCQLSFHWVFTDSVYSCLPHLSEFPLFPFPLQVLDYSDRKACVNTLGFLYNIKYDYVTSGCVCVHACASVFISSDKSVTYTWQKVYHKPHLNVGLCKSSNNFKGRSRKQYNFSDSTKQLNNMKNLVRKYQTKFIYNFRVIVIWIFVAIIIKEPKINTWGM